MTPARRPAAADGPNLISGTTVRFVQMMVLMLVVTAGLATMVDFGDDYGWGCIAAAGVFPRDLHMLDLAVTVDPYDPAMRTCMDRYATDSPLWLMAGWPALLAASTAALFVALPRWRTWRGRRSLTEPDDELAAHLHRLLAGFGMERAPTVLVDTRRQTSANAVVFGSDRRPRIRLDAGLTVLRERRRGDFEAVMLHELAHIGNRDVTVTYLTVAMWRSFVAVVALPFAVWQIARLLQLRESYAVDIELLSGMRALAMAAVAVLVVHFARAEVLRSREIYADRTAKGAGAELRPLFERASRPGTGRWHRTRRLLASLWHSHPSPRVRLAALDRPSELFRVHPALVFTTGVAVILISRQAAGFLPRFQLDSYVADLSVSLIAAALVTAVVGVALWRAAAWSAIHPEHAASGVRPGLWLGAGMVGAELFHDDAGFFEVIPPQPAVLAFLLALGVLFCWWTTQCARLWTGLWRGRSVLPVMAPTLAAGWLALAVALLWWHDHGMLWAAGFDPRSADFAQIFLQDPYYADLGGHPLAATLIGTVSPLLIMLMGEPMVWITVAVCWAVPLAAWAVRTGTGAPLWLGPAARGVDPPPLRRLLWAAATGGAIALAAAVASAAWVHHWSPPGTGPRSLEMIVYLMWSAAAIIAGAAAAAAVGVARTGRYRLASALIASQIATALGFAAVLAVMAADGCVDGVGVVEDRCGADALGPLWNLLSMIVETVAVAAVAVAALVAAVAGAASRLRRRRGRPRAAGAAPGTRSRSAGRLAAAGICALALGFGATVSAAQLPEPVHGSGSCCEDYDLAAPQQLTEGERGLLTLAWFTYGGEDLSLDIIDAFTRLAPHVDEMTAGAVEDEAAVRAACTEIESAVAEADAFFPIPHPEAQQSWRQGLDLMGDASRSCVYAVEQRNPALLTTAVTELVAALESLNAAVEFIAAQSVALERELP